MTRRSRHAVLATLVAFLGAMLSTQQAQAVGVTGVSVVPYDQANDLFPDPAGLLRGSLDRTKDTGINVGVERDIRGSRGNAQTFTVSAEEYGPLGIEVTAFVINYEEYTFNQNNTLAVQLFPVPDANGSTIPSVPAAAETAIVAASGLQIPDGAAAGTAIFHFETPVTLAPGAYAWRFLASNESGTQSKWSLTGENQYPYGQRYEFSSVSNYVNPQPLNNAEADYHFGLIGESFRPRLYVDRTTGNITLENTTSQAINNIIGYSLQSADGTLNADEQVWQTITSGNSEWVVLPSDAYDLSEANMSDVAAPITLGVGSQLNLGNVWLRWTNEANDLSMLLAIDDGTPEGSFMQAEVVFVGGENDLDPFAQGDFNFDGAIDADDYAILVSSLPSTLSVDNVRQAYIAGDINGDFVVDFHDIAPFRAAYELHNGVGSFAALGSSTAVPEPRSIFLLGLIGGCVALFAQRRGLPISRRAIPCMVGLAALVLPTTAQGAINEVTRVEGATTNPYVLVPEGFDLAAKVYIDRTVGQAQVTQLPLVMKGLDYVQTANNDRNRAADQNFAVTLTFDEGTLLYLSVDGRVGDDDRLTPPTFDTGEMGWVLEQGWQPTGMVWTKTDATYTPMFVYSLQPAGTSLTLYEQNAGSINMYSISGGIAAEILPTLVVNTDTGQVSLKNPTQQELPFDYYEILSESGSLKVDSWLSLEQQYPGDNTLEGWSRGGSSSENHLAELSLLGSSALPTNGSFSLGQAYDTSVNGEDLVFKFSLNGEDFLIPGLVEYVTGAGQPGDFNGDGVVDAADYTVWRNNLGGDEAVLGGNGNNDGVVDAVDYTLWKTHFGQPAPAALGLASTQVPEPSSVALLGMAAGGLLYFTRRRSLVALPAKVAVGRLTAAPLTISKESD